MISFRINKKQTSKTAADTNFKCKVSDMFSMPRYPGFSSESPPGFSLVSSGTPNCLFKPNLPAKYGRSVFFLKKKTSLFETKNKNNETNKTPKLDLKIIKTKIKMKLNSNFKVKIYWK